MSGYTVDMFDKQRGFEAGMYFVQKPLSPMNLAEKVRQVLDSQTES